MKLNIFVDRVLEDIRAGVDKANAAAPEGVHVWYPTQVHFIAYIDDDFEAHANSNSGHRVEFAVVCPNPKEIGN